MTTKTTKQQAEQFKNPAQLSEKRKQAFKKTMKITSIRPKPLSAVHSELSEIYKTRSGRKKALKEFNQNPEIPLKIEDQSVKNEVVDYE